MKYIKIGFFGAKDFENAVKICVHSSRARARAKKLQKYVQNTCCISIYMFLGPRISKMQPKLSYTCPGPVHMQKNCKKMCKIHVVYRFICFWGQEFQKCNQNFYTLAQGPCTCKKNCKNVCKIHVVYRFICFWGQEFQKCNQKFCKINQLIKKSKFY